MKELVQNIISEATKLKDEYAKDIPMELDYVCIFCQTDAELITFTKEAERLGKVIEKTPTGKVYFLGKRYPDENGTNILKVRIPDVTRKEQGDCDFKIDDYLEYKEQLLSLPVAKLIVREDSEMIELWDKNFNARAYFSNPPVREQLKIER